MKIIISFLIFIYAVADEPMLHYTCKKGFSSYSNDLILFEICPKNKENFEIDITAKGSSYHSCWWNTTVKFNGESYSAKENDCKVNFKIKDKFLNAIFTGSCRSFCGMRAQFYSGKFKKNELNKEN